MKIQTFRHACSLFTLLTLALALNISTAQAETVNCTAITTLPAIISTSGIHCLKSNKSTNITTGAAITIKVSDVVLDLNGFVLNGYPAGSGTQAIGILAISNNVFLKNITVKNGTVQGFREGLNLGSGDGHLITDIHADANTAYGITISGGIVRNNLVTGTNNQDFEQIGILTNSGSVHVVNNDINGIARAIVVHGFRNLIVNNRITNASHAIMFEAQAGTDGKYRDNISQTTRAPYINGNDAGNNN